MEDMGDHVISLLCAVLEQIEVGEDPEADDRRKALEDKLLGYGQRKEGLREEFAEGEWSPREYKQTLALLDSKMDDVSGDLAKLGVKIRLDLTAAKLRERWNDPEWPLARQRATLMAYISEIRISPATRPYSVLNPDRIDIVWR
ncbi:hypothetical protein amrb99_51560 [Actinomadura sp. RB99]|nr:hypothetical protein [Actinomadura sp. RB99]